MASSPVQICNAALRKLGAERISSLNEINKRAKLCKGAYDDLRREVLRAHPWNFAIAREELPRQAASPEYQFDYQFQLPANCIRVLGTNEDRLNPLGDVLGDSLTKYKIEGRLLLTNTVSSIIPASCSISDHNNEVDCLANGGTWTPESGGTIKIIYIKDETDTTKFDPIFDDLLAVRMAAELAYAIVQSTTLSNAMYNLYERQLQRAKTRDGQEGSPDDLQADFFLASRF